MKNLIIVKHFIKGVQPFFEQIGIVQGDNQVDVFVDEFEGKNIRTVFEILGFHDVKILQPVKLDFFQNLLRLAVIKRLRIPNFYDIRINQNKVINLPIVKDVVDPQAHEALVVAVGEDIY
jgi:hypothetical protein